MRSGREKYDVFTGFLRIVLSEGKPVFLMTATPKKRQLFHVEQFLKSSALKQYPPSVMLRSCPLLR